MQVYDRNDSTTKEFLTKIGEPNIATFEHLIQDYYSLYQEFSPHIQLYAF